MNLKAWLIEKISVETGFDADEISCDESFENFNLDSLAAISMAYEIENEFGLEISPTIFTEFDNINKLSEWMQAKL